MAGGGGGGGVKRKQPENAAEILGSYIKVDNAVALLEDLGQNGFMSKLESFKPPSHHSDWELLGMKWQDLSFFDIQSNLRLRPPLLSDHLSSATSFPK